MKALVTGGAGFIGSHIVDAFIEKKMQVVVVDDLSTGFRKNIHPEATFYEVDIRDQKTIEDIFQREKPDVVNHHAAQMNVTRSVKEPMYDAHVNVLGSLNLLECSRQYGVKKVIYISTGGAVYGEPQQIPCDESHPIRPLVPYGVSKYITELYLRLYGEIHGLPFTILRYPNVFGPRQSPHGEAGVVAIFSELMLQGKRPTIFGDGSKTRDYVFISDIVSANLLALEKGEGETFNLSWGLEVTDYQVFSEVKSAVGVEIEPIFSEKRKGEVEHICLDSTKAREQFGWKPEVSFSSGVEKAVEFYRKKIKEKK